MNKITTILALIGAFVLVAVLVVGCEQSGEPVTPSLDRTAEPMEITVYFYPNSREVTRMYRQLHNIPRGNPVPEHKGFAMWPEWRDPDGEPTERPQDEKLVCEIHTMQPRIVDDDPTMTLGHELLHCVYGSYHRGHYGMR